MIQVCDSRIKSQISFQEKSVGLSLFRDHGKTMIHGFFCASEIHQFIVEVYPACRSGPDTENGFQKFGTSGTYQTVKSEDLSFPHIKRNILEMGSKLCR